MASAKPWTRRMIYPLTVSGKHLLRLPRPARWTAAGPEDFFAHSAERQRPRGSEPTLAVIVLSQHWRRQGPREHGAGGPDGRRRSRRRDSQTFLLTTAPLTA